MGVHEILFSKLAGETCLIFAELQSLGIVYAYVWVISYQPRE